MVEVKEHRPTDPSGRCLAEALAAAWVAVHRCGCGRALALRLWQESTDELLRLGLTGTSGSGGELVAVFGSRCVWHGQTNLGLAIPI